MSRLVLGLLGVALVAVPARATLIVGADLGELVAGADAIVHARVVDVRPVWVDGRRRVESIVTVLTLARLKGDAGAEISFRTPGGQIGPYRTFMVGAPSFSEGEELVLFLRLRGVPVPHVVGLSQGVFRVVADAAGRRLVIPPALVAPDDAGRVVRGASARRPESIERFAERVRTLAARSAGR
ncbi:MAG TPA: hypothetical protein VNI83_14670 [Vicinamibacterales bacterium]|nr:hypothetical protein [Vicinamibacterales bacterium]